MEKTNPLDSVFAIMPGRDYEVDDRQIVTIRIKQDHWIQRFARKLGLSIPEFRRIELDAFGSYALLSIDGTRTVQIIGERMRDKFGEEANPLYERLLVFVNHIEKSEHFIVRVSVGRY